MRTRHLALAALLASIALLISALLAPHSAANAYPWHHRTDRERAWRHDVTVMIDNERAAHGEKALNVNQNLARSARHHDYHMAEVDTLSHCLAFERCMIARDVYYGYWPWCDLGENIGWVHPISLDALRYMQRALYHSPEHRPNILNATFRGLGLDVWIDHAHGRIWMTQDFGRHSGC